jgi:hypothetical protein
MAGNIISQIPEERLRSFFNDPMADLVELVALPSSNTQSIQQVDQLSADLVDQIPVPRDNPSEPLGDVEGAVHPAVRGKDAFDPRDNDHLLAHQRTIKREWLEQLSRCNQKLAVVADRMRFTELIETNSKRVAEEYRELKGISNKTTKATKSNPRSATVNPVCGWDPRLTASQAWIDQFRRSATGHRAWQEADGHIGDPPNDGGFSSQVDSGSVGDAYRGLCVNVNCKSHADWLQTHKDEPKIELLVLNEEKDAISAKLAEMDKSARVRQYQQQWLPKFVRERYLAASRPFQDKLAAAAISRHADRSVAVHRVLSS